MRGTLLRASKFAEYFQGGPIRTCLLIVKTDMSVHEVADRLHQRPAGGEVAKQRPGDVLQVAVRFAIPAREQVEQDLVRQTLHRVLIGIPDLRVGLPMINDDRIMPDRHVAGGNINSPAAVAVKVDVL